MENNKNNGHIAFVFPGQGSQSIGMLAELASSHAIITETFEQASDALEFDLWKLIQHGLADELNQTYNTQPAMLTAGVAVWRLWCQQSDIRPTWVAGHSLGEYTALVCAEAMHFDDALKLVTERGRLMQEAVPVGVGAMAAILGLKDQQVIDVCEQVAENEVVSAVNFNSPGQVVIAGHVAAVERAMLAAKEVGAKRAIKLPVSVPSHCSLMESAAKKLHVKLQQIKVNLPKITLIHNVDANHHESPEIICNALIEQLFKPVRWVESINAMHNQGATSFVELGPGKVLMGVNKRIVKTANHSTLYDLKTLDTVLEKLNG
ncbi:MAG: ACP S-malonyltransferase [Methylococcales bacterium]|nr:ACP S-malonyltransferase [Methylococcales bacterium]